MVGRRGGRWQVSDLPRPPASHACLPTCHARAPPLQDPRTRPTARFLQQHKFVARDCAAAAVRALLPLVQQARTHMAEMALMAGIEGTAGAVPGTPGAGNDGTWLPASAAPTPSAYPPHAYGAPAGTPGAAQQQQQAGGGYQATMAAGAGPMMRASADGASPAASGEASGTVVVRQSMDSSLGWGATVVVTPGAGPPSAQPRRVGAWRSAGAATVAAACVLV